MLTIAILLAAGQAPVQLASYDEIRWQRFVRASVSAPRPPDRMSELAATVGRLPADARRDRRPGMGGPSGM
jgi:hypothetical protein